MYVWLFLEKISIHCPFNNLVSCTIFFTPSKLLSQTGTHQEKRVFSVLCPKTWRTTSPWIHVNCRSKMPTLLWLWHKMCNVSQKTGSWICQRGHEYPCAKIANQIPWEGKLCQIMHRSTSHNMFIYRSSASTFSRTHIVQIPYKSKDWLHSYVVPVFHET